MQPVQTAIQPTATPTQGALGITVTLFSEFLLHPPRDFFEVVQGPTGHPIYVHDKHKVNVCLDLNYFPGSMDK